MKRFIYKVKKATKDFFTNKSAFSLVELIVVIAIMAVMAAVLAPALLGYVEKSRMQKDDSAMDEVVNAIQLSLADQSVYDEVLEHSVWDNVSCYIDQKEESKFASHKVQLKAANGDKKEQYMFGDEARLLDETVYYAAGNMRGLTITFSPSESGDTYDFANGILNKFVGRKTGLLSENPELYNRLRSVIGDKLDTTSQTYRNSDYTIFIRVGSTGGAEAVMQDAIQVWGQFNGTNLDEKDHKFELSSGRVVGAAGENDASNNQVNNENNQNEIFSESYLGPLTKWVPITWKGLTSFSGHNIWTDGTNTYYSKNTDQYVLNGDTWEVKTWEGKNPSVGNYIWTDGTNIYYSYASNQYILRGNTWQSTSWRGYSNFLGSTVWTDGTNMYCSDNFKPYILNGNQWTNKRWRLTPNSADLKIDGASVWTDGTNIYYSDGYIYNGSAWETKTWNGLTDFEATMIWTDGTYTYYSRGSEQYVLNEDTDTWEIKSWINAPTNLGGEYIWTDGTNYYFSSGTKQYMAVR